MLYVFFWAIFRRLNFICRRFGTLCLFHLHRRVGRKDDWGREFWSIYTGNAYRFRLFSSQTFFRINTPTFSTAVILHTYRTDSVPKRRYIKFRRRRINQMKAYNKSLSICRSETHLDRRSADRVLVPRRHGERRL